MTILTLKLSTDEGRRTEYSTMVLDWNWSVLSPGQRGKWLYREVARLQKKLKKRQKQTEASE